MHRNDPRLPPRPSLRRLPPSTFALLCALLGAIVVGFWTGCSASSNNGENGGNGQGLSTTGTGGSGVGGGIGGNLFGGNGNGGATAELVIQPSNPVLTYTGSPVTQQFTALDNGQPVSPTW